MDRRQGGGARPRGRTVTDVSSSTARAAQIELFGLVAAGNGLTTLSAPCRQCLSTVGVVGAGSGPHYKSLCCLRGHFQAWLPRPRRRQR
jgi:hypothetical protein